MAETSTIEWTDATWTPIRASVATPYGPKIGWHCEHVSEGCRNCYAEKINLRLGTRFEFKPGHLLRETGPHRDVRGDVEPFLDENMLERPLRWRRPRMIFVCSMTDLFADFVPDEWIDKVFAVMSLAHQHKFQVLTKRPERALAYLTADGGFGRWGYIEHHARHLANIPAGKTLATYGGSNLPNVWLGTSVEDHATAEARVPHLLAAPASVRFLSAEPLLGPIVLHERLGGDWLASGKSGERRGIDWMIVGGESGPGARPMHPDWARRLRDQCVSAGVPFFFKQWGAWLPACQDPNELWDWSEDENRGALHFWDDQTGSASVHLRKAAAGRVLDGRVWDEMPGARL